MKKLPNVVTNILKKLQTDYNKIEEERNKYKENMKTKKVQKKVIDRHAYISNIEKKLNEIVAHSMEIKKQDKKLNYSLSHKNLPLNDDHQIFVKNKRMTRIEKLKVKLKIDEKTSMKNKDRLCRLFFSTGICRWGDKCNFAHSVKEIEGEYHPIGSKKKKIY